MKKPSLSSQHNNERHEKNINKKKKEAKKDMEGKEDIQESAIK